MTTDPTHTIDDQGVELDPTADMQEAPLSGAASLLVSAAEAVKQEIEEVRRGKTVVLEVPGTDGRVFARYHAVEYEQLVKQWRRTAAKQKGADPSREQLDLSMDLLGHLCDSLRLRDVAGGPSQSMAQVIREASEAGGLPGAMQEQFDAAARSIADLDEVTYQNITPEVCAIFGWTYRSAGQLKTTRPWRFIIRQMFAAPSRESAIQLQAGTVSEWLAGKHTLNEDGSGDAEQVVDEGVEAERLGEASAR